jgi:RNA polymerase sigma-70 factor (ECF subfamily)
VTRAGLHIARPAEPSERAGATDVRPPAQSFGRCAPAPPAELAAPLREALLLQLDALYRFILVRVGFDEAAADDVLQQTAETALRAETTVLAGVDSVEGWLRGVARNLVRRHWRENGKRSAKPHPDPDAGRRALAALESGCPAEALSQRELRLALLWAVASLPAADQWLLYAVYRYGKSQQEIAAELGCTQKGIEMRLYRTRTRLRDALAACGEDA